MRFGWFLLIFCFPEGGGQAPLTRLATSEPQAAGAAGWLEGTMENSLFVWGGWAGALGTQGRCGFAVCYRMMQASFAYWL